MSVPSPAYTLFLSLAPESYIVYNIRLFMRFRDQQAIRSARKHAAYPGRGASFVDGHFGFKPAR